MVSTTGQSDPGESSGTSSTASSAGSGPVPASSAGSSVVSGAGSSAGVPPAPSSGRVKPARGMTPWERRHLRPRPHAHQRRQPPPPSSFFSWNNGWGKVIALSVLLVALCIVLGVLVVMSYKIVTNPLRRKSLFLKALMSSPRVTAASE